VAEASAKFDETTTAAKNNAKDAKDTVKDNVKEVQHTAEQTGKELNDTAQDTVQDTAEKIEDKVDSTQQTSTDDHSEEESLPQTPLGGTDPTADGAPSFAAMTAEPPHEIDRSHIKKDAGIPAATPKHSKTEDEDYDPAQLPHTPLGGTDPTAEAAPSFAQAVAHKVEQDFHHDNDQSGDQLPHTPFGGTDPLATGAPSYAAAIAE
jgi:hypothetical protein